MQVSFQRQLVGAIAALNRMMALGADQKGLVVVRCTTPALTLVSNKRMKKPGRALPA